MSIDTYKCRSTLITVDHITVEVKKKRYFYTFKFYGFVNLRVVFQNTRRIKSFFSYKDHFNRSQKSKIVYKASAGIVMLFTSAKLKQDYMIERLSTSKLSLKLVTPPLFLSIRFPPVTTSNGTILRS